MTSWSSPIASPATEAPADELTAVLQTLRDRLRVLMSADCALRPDETASCLDELYSYLVDELTPVLHAISVRIHPALHRDDGDGDGDGWQAAVDNAALLRLSERVALLRAEHALLGSSTRTRTELAAVTQWLAELATAHLDREQRTLSPRLRRLPAAEAELIVDTARRTARASADAPRRDLLPAGL